MSGFSGGAAGATAGGGFTLGATGAPGAGSFTPVRLTEGFPPGMLPRAGACGLFLFLDGSAWELRWGFYTGAVITRPTNGFVASSTGSALTLGAAATVTMMQEAGLFETTRGEYVASHLPQWNSTSLSTVGFQSMSASGAALTGLTITDTNLMTRQPALRYDSATTANANCGTVAGTSQTSRNAGFAFNCRFGATQLPTGPRLLIGFETVGGSLSADPSANVNAFAFAKDSADTNIQLMNNDGAGACTKTDTAIALAINTFYEANLWCDPAGASMSGLLVDYTNQALWYGSVSTNLPVAGTALIPQAQGGLAATTGTAFRLVFGGLRLRSGV